MLRRALCLSFGAGVMIAIGGAVFLACDSRYAGAVFFTVALLCICFLGLFLYTGKVGYLLRAHSGRDVGELLLTLFGNLLGTLAAGLAIGAAKPAYIETARALCEGKLAAPFGQTLLAGVFCGVLMYAAVEIYKSKGSPLGILFCVPVFILAGFEHSIADMFYVFCARLFTARGFAFLGTVVLGNSLGGLLLPALTGLAEEKDYAKN